MKSWLFGRIRLPVVNMMNFCNSDMLCWNNTDDFKPVSYEEVQVCLGERCRKRAVDWSWDFFYFFFWKREEKQKVLKCISFSWQQLLRTKLAFQMTFQRCRRHPAKSSWSYGDGRCRKNKHLVEEEQSSGKKKRVVNQREIEGRKMLEEGRREERRVLPGKSSPNNSFLTSLVSKFAK